MKLSTVLGSLLLTALQADASPITNGEQSIDITPKEVIPELEARGGSGWCCVGG